MVRKLVTIRTVSDVSPIPGADNIEVATIDGWKCVVKKGEFEEGGRGLYFEIDSFLPAADARFKFLEKTFTNFNNVYGARVRTIKLRGQISQGLLLPLEHFPEVKESLLLSSDKDYSEVVGVVKWELPEPTGAKAPSLTRFGKFAKKLEWTFLRPLFKALQKKYPRLFRGQGNALFPSFIPKSDECRIQNIRNIVDYTGVYEATIKLDGSSMTVYQNQKAFGVCSRNFDLAEDKTNQFWATANTYRLKQALKEYKRNIAIQGELIGPGIQGNREGLAHLDWYVFKIYDIDNERYCTLDEKTRILENLESMGYPLKTVPSLGCNLLSTLGTIDKFLEFAEGPSLCANTREGVVFHEVHGQRSFKVISNSYLLKHKE